MSGLLGRGISKLLVLASLASLLVAWSEPGGDPDIGWLSALATTTPGWIPTPTPTVATCSLAHSNWCPTDGWSDWEYWGALRSDERVKCHVLEDEQLGYRLPNDRKHHEQYRLKKTNPNGGTLCRYWVRHRIW